MEYAATRIPYSADTTPIATMMERIIKSSTRVKVAASYVNKLEAWWLALFERKSDLGTPCFDCDLAWRYTEILRRGGVWLKFIFFRFAAGFEGDGMRAYQRA